MKEASEINLQVREAAAKGSLGSLIEIFGISRDKKTSADINAAGPSTGKTALHQAVLNNRLEIVNYLLKFDTIRLTTDKAGKTPYDYAQQKDLKPILRSLARKFLIWDRLAIPSSDLTYKLGSDYLMVLKDNLSSYSTQKIIDISKSKIPTGSLYQGYTLLHLVLWFTSNWLAIRSLVKAGEEHNIQVAPFQPLGYRNTPLHMLLADENVMDILTFLKIIHEEGKKLNFTLQDSEGKTTLLLAAKIRSAICVRALLQIGARTALKIPDENGYNIVHVVCILGDIDTFKIVREYPECTELLEQTDYAGRKPSDLLKLSEDKTALFIESIHIDPLRDIKAPSNSAKPGSFKPEGTRFIDACFKGRVAIENELNVLKKEEAGLERPVI